VEPAVLGHPLFGNVQPGEDLDSRADRGLEVLRRGLGLAQNAVNPVPHPQLFPGRLDVNVARLLPGPLGQDQIDQLDHGSFLRGQADLGFFFRRLLEVDLLFVQALDHLVDRTFHPVVMLQGGVEVLFGRDRRLHLTAGLQTRLVQRHHVGRVGHRHGQGVADLKERQHPTAPGGLLRHQVEDLRVDQIVREADEGHAG